MRNVWALLLVLSAAPAQSPEAGRIERSGDEATLFVDGPRPVDSAAITLAERYGIRLSVEDPPYICSEDVIDVTASVARSAPARSIFVPRGGSLKVRFPLSPDGRPRDPEALISELIRTANETFPYSYQLRQVDGSFVIVPTTTRDQLCGTVEFQPMLERRVTIPRARRTIAESANLLAQALSKQTGLRVGCCQASIGGIPWGLEEVEFGADNEIARDVLIRLINATLHGKPNPYFWLLRCDPLPSEWCFINLMSRSIQSTH